MDVQFLTSIAPIVRKPEASRSFYGDALGLGFEDQEGDYVFTHELEGSKHFGLWPLSEAACACFGTSEWPAEVPVPQASLEFEVSDVPVAAAELSAKLTPDRARAVVVVAMPKLGSHVGRSPEVVLEHAHSRDIRRGAGQVGSARRTGVSPIP